MKNGKKRRRVFIPPHTQHEAVERRSDLIKALHQLKEQIQLLSQTRSDLEDEISKLNRFIRRDNKEERSFSV